VGRIAADRLSLALSKDIRTDFRSRLKLKQLNEFDVSTAPGFSNRTERWVRNAFDDKKQLARITAVELTRRLTALGVKVPEALIWRLRSPDEAPIVIVPEGEAEHLAAYLAAEASKVMGIGLVSKDRLAKCFLRVLIRFENFERTATGQRVTAALNELTAALSELGDMARSDEDNGVQSDDRRRWLFEQWCDSKTVSKGAMTKTPKASVMLARRYTAASFPKSPTHKVDERIE
jgi:hypothetical protein